MLPQLRHPLLGDNIQHTACLSPCELLNHVSGICVLLTPMFHHIANRPLTLIIGLLWLSVINQHWTSLVVLVGFYTVTISPIGSDRYPFRGITPDLPV